MLSINLKNYGFPLANMDFRNILSSSTPAVPVAWCRMSADTLYFFDFDHVLQQFCIGICVFSEKIRVLGPWDDVENFEALKSIDLSSIQTSYSQTKNLRSRSPYIRDIFLVHPLVRFRGKHPTDKVVGCRKLQPFSSNVECFCQEHWFQFFCTVVSRL